MTNKEIVSVLLKDDNGFIPIKSETLADLLASYAKQMSIDFLKWVDENCVVSSETDDRWDLICWMPTETKSTAEQLYEIYLKEVNHPKQ